MNNITNRRTLKNRISAGGSHDSSHFHFARQRRSATDNLLDDAIGVLACVVLLLVVLFSGAAF